MKAIKISYDKKSDQVALDENSRPESWIKVCEGFDDDVHRLRDAVNHPPYTGLYECFDEDNQPTYFLVEEDSRLKSMRQKVFLSKLGR